MNSLDAPDLLSFRETLAAAPGAVCGTDEDQACAVSTVTVQGSARVRGHLETQFAMEPVRGRCLQGSRQVGNKAGLT